MTTLVERETAPGPAALLPPVGSAPPRPLHAAAAEIRALARSLPRWDPFDPDGWEAFERRRLAGERALSARLSRLPGCTVVASPDGWEVELTLAGITTRSRNRLHGACTAWAAAACR